MYLAYCGCRQYSRYLRYCTKAGSSRKRFWASPGASVQRKQRCRSDNCLATPAAAGAPLPAPLPGCSCAITLCDSASSAAARLRRGACSPAAAHSSSRLGLRGPAQTRAPRQSGCAHRRPSATAGAAPAVGRRLLAGGRSCCAAEEERAARAWGGAGASIGGAFRAAAGGAHLAHSRRRRHGALPWPPPGHGRVRHPPGSILGRIHVHEQPWGRGRGAAQITLVRPGDWCSLYTGRGPAPGTMQHCY